MPDEVGGDVGLDAVSQGPERRRDGHRRIAGAVNFADVGEMQSVDELQGEAELGVPLSFPVKSLIEPKPPTDQTAAAATLLTDFVRALVNLNENEIDAAREHIEAAVDHTDRYVGIYGPFGGLEVVYVFASHIARLQADQSPAGSAVRQSHLAAAEGHVMRALLDINPNYGRGFIALGNVQFEREMYGAALRTYAAAAALTKQPLDDLISLKATMGMANVNWEQLRVMPAGTPCAGEVGIWAGEAERHYSAVIAVQAAEGSDDARLRAMAARALTYRGEVHRFCGRTDAALADYRAALDLEPGPPLDGELRRLLVALTGEEE